MMKPEQFSMKAAVVVEQARHRFKDPSKQLASIHSNDILRAAILSGFDVCTEELDGSKALILRHRCGAFAIRLTDMDAAQAEWKPEVGLRVRRDGKALTSYLKVPFDIQLLPETIEELAAFTAAFEQFLAALEQNHVPELSLCCIPLAQPLEQEHTASGQRWFLRAELDGK